MDAIGITQEVEGSIGYLTLSQPKTLNALTLEMVNALNRALRSHIENEKVQLILLRSTHPKAFCAGGDMKQLCQLSKNNDIKAVGDFFKSEYALNQAIATCPKPYLSLINGIAMGGGLGLSVHGRYRIVTEKALLAMPESKIGFFPDVGASYFLPRLAHRAGWWLGLTATPVKNKEAIRVGLATHYLPSTDIDAFIDKLQTALPQIAKKFTDTDFDVKNQHIDNLVQECCWDNNDQDTKEIVDALELRASWFSDNELQLTHSRLTEAAAKFEDADYLLNAMLATSPYSHKITLEMFNQTRNCNLDECLQYEFKLALEAISHPDFFEGIRAVLIDKDNAPNWTC